MMITYTEVVEGTVFDVEIQKNNVIYVFLVAFYFTCMLVIFLILGSFTIFHFVLVL